MVHIGFEETEPRNKLYVKLSCKDSHHTGTYVEIETEQTEKNWRVVVTTLLIEYRRFLFDMSSDKYSLYEFIMCLPDDYYEAKGYLATKDIQLTVKQFKEIEW